MAADGRGGGDEQLGPGRGLIPRRGRACQMDRPLRPLQVELALHAQDLEDAPDEAPRVAPKAPDPGDIGLELGMRPEGGEDGLDPGRPPSG